MKKKYKVLAVALIALVNVLSYNQLLAQDSKIPFQGVLYEQGEPVNGSKEMVFTIAEPEWAETQTVQVINGLYSVILGEIIPLPSVLFVDVDFREMGITVAGTDIGVVKLYAPFRNFDYTVDATGYDTLSRLNAIQASIFGDNVPQNRYLNGVYGYAATNNGINAGVRGEAASTAENSQFQYGVLGRSFGSGTGARYGARGEVHGDGTGFSAGVRGQSFIAPPEGGQTLGGDFTAFEGAVGAWSYGVRGAARGAGTNIGVHGSAQNGVENWAGWFDGDVNVNGNLMVNGQELGSNLDRYEIGNNAFSNWQAGYQFNGVYGAQINFSGGIDSLGNILEGGGSLGNKYWEADYPQNGYLHINGSTGTKIRVEANADESNEWGTISIINHNGTDATERIMLDGYYGSINVNGVNGNRSVLLSSEGENGNDGNIRLSNELGYTKGILFANRYNYINDSTREYTGSGGGWFSGNNGKMSVSFGSRGVNNNYGFLDLGDENGNSSISLDAENGNINVTGSFTINGQDVFSDSISNNIDTDNRATLTVTQSGTNGSNFAAFEVYSNADTTAYGIFSQANGSGDNYGMYGHATGNTTSGTGVHGFSNISSGTSIGVHGQVDVSNDSNSSFAIGVRGTAQGSLTTNFSVGTYGQNTVTGGSEAWGTGGYAGGEGINKAFRGRANSLDGNTAEQYGAWLQANGAGTGNHYGVWTNAMGLGNNYGVYATASGGTQNWAGWFDGDVKVNGTISMGNDVKFISLQSEDGGIWVSDNLNSGANIFAETQIYTNGNMFAVAFNTTSDKRYKKNISTIKGALATTQSLRGVTYNWRVNKFKNKGFNNENQVGLIAQEVEAVLPELVHTDKEGMKSVNYAQLTAVLVEAVKELNAKITTLESENSILKTELSKVSSLEEKIKQIEVMLSGSKNDKSLSASK